MAGLSLVSSCLVFLVNALAYAVMIAGFFLLAYYLYMAVVLLVRLAGKLVK